MTLAPDPFTPSAAIEDAALLLETCRMLRHVDTAIAAAREELDEVASLVVRARAVDTPPALLERLEVAVARIRDLEGTRATYAGRIAEVLAVA
jgi:hypothetical protein